MNARQYTLAALYRGFRPLKLSAMAAALGVSTSLAMACDPETMAACVGDDPHAGVIKSLALDGLKDHIGEIAIPIKSRAPIVFGLVKMRGGKKTVVLNYASGGTGVNIYTDATTQLGSAPTGPWDVIINVSSVIKGSPGVAGPGAPGGTAMLLGSGWGVGSTFRLNLTSAGVIAGGGGAGRSGDSFNGSGVIETDVYQNDGGDALYLNGFAITIDNAGYIFGGGGGGGGGGAAADNVYGSHTNGAGGGGGGGGEGGNGGGGGGFGLGYGGGGANGNGGNNGASYPSFGPGTAGAGALIFFATSGAGGDGGAYGQNGNNPTAGSSGVSGGYESAGSGNGNAGYAVRLVGGSVTWLSGNNGTQVKGNVG